MGSRSPGDVVLWGALEAECELQMEGAVVGEEHLRATELGPEAGRAIPDHD